MVTRLQFASVLGLALSMSQSIPLVQASDKQACLDAYDQAQTLRQSGNLLEARTQLLTCANRSCPPFITKDCTQWLGDVEAAIASVVFEVRDAEGALVLDVQVHLGTTVLVDGLTGRAVQVNPGVHEFVFEHRGARATKRVAVLEGTKNTVVSVKFPSAHPTIREDPKPRPEALPERVSTPGWVYPVGALGLLGVGGFAYFGLSFDSQVEDLEKCRPACSSDAVDRASTTRLLAVGSGAVGIAALGMVSVALLSQSSQEQAREGANVGAVPLPGGALGVLSGRW